MKHLLRFALVCFSLCNFAFAIYEPMPPFQVQNVKATAKDNDIVVTWDAVDDQDGGVITGYKVYYGTTPVKNAADSYDAEQIVSGADARSYTLADVLPGVTYFIAITGIDDERDESSHFSVETSAMVSPAGAQDGPKVVSARVISPTKIELSFSKEVVVQSPLSSFAVQDTQTQQMILVSDAAPQGSTILLSFVENSFAPGHSYMIMASPLIKDVNGTPVSNDKDNTAEFTVEMPAIAPSFSGSGESSIPTEQTKEPFGPFFPEEETDMKNSAPAVSLDTIAPADAKNIRFDSSLLSSEKVIVLSWTASEDSDAADQILFTRKGMGSWDSGYSLGKSTSELELEVDLNQNYETKIVTIDRAGNQSPGATFSFTTVLAKTGPDSLPLVFALMALTAGVIAVKKRENC